MRLFVAVWPPDELVADLAALERPELAGVRWTTRDQWHVTLRFLGEVDSSAPVERALDGVGRAVAPTIAVAGPRTTRVRNMLWLRVDGLADVATAVIDATREIGAPPDARPFRGHMTLARQRGRRRGDALRVVAGAAVGRSWTVDAIDLVQSRLGPEGASYTTRCRVALRGPVV